MQTLNIDTRTVQEAVVVGAALLPIYSVVHEVVDARKKNRELLAVFLSGVVFHLVAEATGLNEWYIHHGAATDKWLSGKKNKKNVATGCSGLDGRVCPLAVQVSDARSY